MRRMSRPAPAGEELPFRPPTVDELVVLGKVSEGRSSEPTRRRRRVPRATEEGAKDLLQRFLSGTASRAECRNVVRVLLRRGAQSGAHLLIEEE